MQVQASHDQESREQPSSYRSIVDREKDISSMLGTSPPLIKELSLSYNCRTHLRLCQFALFIWPTLLHQIFLADCQQPDELVARSFISASEMTENNYMIPGQFNEKALSRIFNARVLAK